VLARGHPAPREIPGRFPLRAPLSWAQFQAFVRERGAERRRSASPYRVQHDFRSALEPGAARWNSAAGLVITGALITDEQAMEDQTMPRVPFAMIGFLGIALLAGCADVQDQVQDVLGTEDNEPRTLAFECDDDLDFSARLSGNREEARVDVGDETYELDLTDRQDGDRVYSDEEGVELTLGDEETYLRIPGGSDFQNCERV
jgi:hypothetical protein